LKDRIVQEKFIFWNFKAIAVIYKGMLTIKALYKADFSCARNVRIEEVRYFINQKILGSSVLYLIQFYYIY